MNKNVVLQNICSEIAFTVCYAENINLQKKIYKCMTL